MTARICFQARSPSQARRAVNLGKWDLLNLLGSVEHQASRCAAWIIAVKSRGCSRRSSQAILVDWSINCRVSVTRQMQYRADRWSNLPQYRSELSHGLRRLQEIL